MVEKPIIFKSEMVRAILDGRKTQTRRVIKELRGYAGDNPDKYYPHKYKPGDRLWVRETWAMVYNQDGCLDEDGIEGYKCPCPGCHVEYKADTGAKYPGGWDDDMGDDPSCGRWKSPLHHPRWASRITLEITAVRIERLQDISEYDASQEGDPKQGVIASENTHTDWFIQLWDSINLKRGYAWETNPWVYRIEFKRVK